MTDRDTIIDSESFQAAGWREVTREDFLSFRQKQDSVEVGGNELSLFPEVSATMGPAEDYELERTTLWSFPDRGDWATHRGNYRGNWSPYIPRNLILKFTEPGDVVLDQMCGSGTTLTECKLLGRDAIGVDVNPESVVIEQSRIDFEIPESVAPERDPEIRTFNGDARHLEPLADESIDLIATHPPYANIISYTRKKVDEDLSSMAFPEFLEAMGEVAQEAYRVLKPGKYCGILAGDTRKKKHYVPVSLGILNAFLDAGFVLKEDIIKAQWNTQETRRTWRGRNYDFQLIAHEHLFLFRKLGPNEESSAYKWSTKWW